MARPYLTLTHSEHFDELSVTNIICRMDNIFIALFIEDWFASSITLGWKVPVSRCADVVDSVLGSYGFFSAQLHWNLQHIMLSTLFVNTHTLNDDVWVYGCAIPPICPISYRILSIVAKVSHPLTLNA